MSFTMGVVKKSNEIHKALEVSFTDESGWRKSNPSVITQLECKLPSQFGMNNFRNSRLLCDADGKVLVDKEGKLLIADGKSCANAVYNLSLKYQEVDQQTSGLSDNCWEAVTDGYRYPLPL